MDLSHQSNNSIITNAITAWWNPRDAETAGYDENACKFTIPFEVQYHFRFQKWSSRPCAESARHFSVSHDVTITSQAHMIPLPFLLTRWQSTEYVKPFQYRKDESWLKFFKEYRPSHSLTESYMINMHKHANRLSGTDCNAFSENCNAAVGKQ